MIMVRFVDPKGKTFEEPPTEIMASAHCVTYLFEKGQRTLINI